MNEKDFKTLQAEWYEKLRKSGFKDIEGASKDLSLTTRFKNKKGFKIENITIYYAKCMDFYQEYDFKKPKHKQVWLLHSNGESIRKIAKTLKLSKSNIHRIVKHYETIMLGAY